MRGSSFFLFLSPLLELDGLQEDIISSQNVLSATTNSSYLSSCCANAVQCLCTKYVVLCIIQSKLNLSTAGPSLIS